jgi:hypothetical protein
MADGYRIIFTGRLQKGRKPAEILKRISDEFGADPAKVRSMFKGKGSVVLTVADREQAIKYTEAFKRAGALCTVSGPGEPRIPEPPGPQDGYKVVLPEPGPKDVTLSPVTCTRITGAEGGVDLNRPDRGAVPYGDLALVSVFNSEDQSEEYRLLIFVAGAKRPYMTDANMISFGDFPGASGSNLRQSLRNFIRHLLGKNPGMAVDRGTADFISGSPPPLFTKDTVILSTALYSALGPGGVPPAPEAVSPEGAARCPKCGHGQPDYLPVCAQCGFNMRGRARKQEAEVEISPDTGAVMLDEPGRTGGRLPDIEELFRSSWDVYKKRAPVLIAICFIAIFACMAAFVAFPFGGLAISLALPDMRIALIACGAALGSLVGIVAGCWGWGAFVYAVSDEALGIKAALRRGWQGLWPFIWLLSLLSYIITGGYLLLFIPGILFLLWFGFAPFVLAVEGEGGMNALLRSREYVRGRWFDVFLRLFVIWIVSAVAGAIPFLGLIISILFMPFMMIYVLHVYQGLRAEKGGLKGFSPSTGNKAFWLGAGSLGYVVVVVLTVLLLGAALTDMYREIRQDVATSLTAKAPGSVQEVIWVKTAPGKVLAKGGGFIMGDPCDKATRDERPLHNVCLKDSHMDAYGAARKEPVLFNPDVSQCLFPPLRGPGGGKGTFCNVAVDPPLLLVVR